MTILQISPSDIAGGAERSAKNLFHAFKTLGHESFLAVGRKTGKQKDVLVLPNDEYRNGWVQGWSQVLANCDSKVVKIRGLGRLVRLIRSMGEPSRWICNQLGVEDFDFPATRHLLQLSPHRPDILHCHNLHGEYFDLRQLPSISAAVPTVLNVRDAWMTSGHCAFSLGCQKWMTGCGKCPDLSLFPAAKRDATSYNWKRKKSILGRSRVYLATPSKWMMDIVERSILAPSIIDARVIPNGVDTSTFHPGSQSVSRKQLGLPSDAVIMMTAAYGLRNNIWKDYKTLHSALAFLGRVWTGRDLLMLVVGENGREEKIGKVTVRNIPYQIKSSDMVHYYRASNLYLHAAKVESFGNVLIEARACGTPVISTAVGGIPEQIKSLGWNGIPADIRSYGIDEATGVLTPPGDGRAMGTVALDLLNHPERCRALSDSGIKDIDRNFSVFVQAERFLSWYREILLARSGNCQSH